MKRLLSLAFVAAISLMIFSTFGCEESDLGRYCVVGFDNASGGDGVKAINSEAPECLERICILQTKVVRTDDTVEEEEVVSTRFCSKKCSGDGDCKGGDSQAGCTGGFVCIRLGQESQDLEGKCICECRDYLTTPDLCYSRCSESNSKSDSCCDGTDPDSCPEQL